METWKPSLVAGTKWYVASRVFLAVVVVLAQGIPRSTPAAPVDDPVLRVLVAWDAGWYLAVASQGYHYTPGGGQHNVCFFPLFPLLARAVGIALGGSGWAYIWGCVLVSNVLFWGSLVLLHRLTSYDFSRVVSDRACCLLAFYPTTIVCSSLYSESTYLFTTLAAFLAMRGERALQSGVWAALAAATRAVGLVMAAAFVTRGLQAWRRGEPAGSWAAAAAITAAGTALFFGWLAWRFRVPLLYLEVQRTGWGRTSPIDSLVSFFGDIPLALTALWHGIPEAFTLSYPLFALFAAGAWGLSRLQCPLRLPMLAYTLAAMLIYLTSATRCFDGGSRYLMVCVPVYPVLALWSEERPWLGRLLLFWFVAQAACIAGLFSRGYYVI